MKAYFTSWKPVAFAYLLLLLSGAKHSYGQRTPNTAPAAPVRLPATPNVAALERYALMPVNEAAGTPAIGVPLYEVHSGALSLSLSLSYHASGIRVGDQASWVGLGWALNGGGVITRQVRGLADELPQGFANNYNQVPRYEDVDCEDDETLLDEIVKSHVDYQPDLYTYNFQGQTGSFMLGNDGVFHSLPLKPVRIQQLDTAFRLTDAQGVTYWFAHRERSHTTGRPPASIRYTSAWFLSRVVSADKADTIRLEYTPTALSSAFMQQQHTLISNLSRGINELASPPTETFTETTGYNYQESFRLQRIVFRGGEIRFHAANRTDIPADKRLVAVTILSGKQDTLRQFQLYHSYFTGEPRLRLDSLTTVSGRLSLPPYKFTYNTLPLPDRLFGSRDHWGYYNGANPVASRKAPFNTALLIPRMQFNHYGNLATYTGADRTPNPTYVQAGILTDIQFPTSGTQHFTYEPNFLPEQYQLPNRIQGPRLTIETNGPGPLPYATGMCATAVDTLTVTQANAMVRYVISGQMFDTAQSRHNQFHLFIYSLTSPRQLIRTVSRSFQQGSYLVDSIALGVGQYEMQLRSCGNTSSTVILTPYYRLPNPQFAWRNALTGGLRLREQRIQASPQSPATIKTYTYNTPGTALSSGYLISATVPLYARYHLARVPAKRWCDPCGMMDPPPPPPIDITYVTLSANSLSELNSGDRPVGYRYVTVTDSATTGETKGYTVSAYRAATDEQGGWKPARPLVSNAWQRDQLLEQRTYASKQGGVPTLLSLTQNEYVFRDTLEITGFVASTDAEIQYGPTINKPQPDIFPYIFENSRQTSGYQYLRQTRQYQYAPNDTAAYQRTTTSYRYDNPAHQQPTLVTTDVAGGQRQLVRARYVADFDTAQVSASSPASARALRELARLHAPAQLIEQTTLHATPTDTLVTRSQLTLSRALAKGIVVTDRQLELRTAVPINRRSFAPARLQNGQLRVDARYQPQLFFDRYSAERQPAQTHVAGGLPVSYLWDRYAGQPLAQATASLTQLAVTSFEPGATGRWAYDLHRGIGQRLVENAGRTGSWAYQLNSGWPVSRDSLPAGDYILRCWYQGSQPPQVLGVGGNSLGVLQPVGSASGPWRVAYLRLHLATPGRVQVSAPGSGTPVLVDDLALYPVGTQLTCYTYDALRGLTSQTGPDGRTTFFEYDALGRLVRTRDEQGRILSQQQYHYTTQR